MNHSLTAVFDEANSPLNLKIIKVPDLKKGEILIKNKFVSLCRSDIHTFIGKRMEKTPTILGHEVVGVIEAFGEGTPIFDIRNQELKRGDMVSWAIFSSNPDSPLSLEGMPQKAEELFKYGHEHLEDDNTLHGGLSSYIILRKNTPIAKIDSQIPLPVSALINCSMATISGAIRLLGKVNNNNYLVTGAGMLGLAACAMLKTLGAKSVSVVENNPIRLQKAKKFGGDYFFESLTELNDKAVNIFGIPNPFHGLIETTGVSKIMEDSLETLKLGGIAVWVGAVFPDRKINLSAEKVVRNLWTIKGLHNYNIQDFIQAVKFAEENHTIFPFVELVECTFTLNEVNEAFHYAVKNNAIRVGIQITE
jgi:putative phosphonate catabolism associated alcohol dehydrogenase